MTLPITRGMQYPQHGRAHSGPAIHPDAMTMTHAQLQARILKRCKQLRFLVHHDFEWCPGTLGFPDLVIGSPNGGWLLIWELKTVTGLLTPEQQLWGDTLKAAGLRYSVMTPVQWFDGTIERALTELAESADAIDLARVA